MFVKDYVRTADRYSEFSGDPRMKVGCVITLNDKIVGGGFNRMPLKSKVDFPWNHDKPLVESKYPYVIHAEMAAIASINENVTGDLECYVTLFPCSNCAKMLIEFGVKRIYYTSDKYADKEDVIASKRLLEGCGVEFIKVEIEEERKVYAGKEE